MKESKKIVSHYSSEKYKELTSEISTITKSKNDIEVSQKLYYELIKELKDIEEEYRFNIDQGQEESTAELDSYRKQVVLILNQIRDLTADKDFEIENRRKEELSKNLVKKRGELDEYMQSQGVSEEDSSLYERAVENIPILESKIKSNKLKLVDIQRDIKNYQDTSQEIGINNQKFETQIMSALIPLNEQMLSDNSNVSDIKFSTSMIFSKEKSSRQI